MWLLQTRADHVQPRLRVARSRAENDQQVHFIEPLRAHEGSGAVEFLSVHPIQVEVGELEETDWYKKTYPILLDENLMLYRLIDELYRQINFLNESLERHHQYQLEDIARARAT